MQQQDNEAPDDGVRARSESGTAPPSHDSIEQQDGEAAAMEQVQEEAAEERKDERGYQ